MLTDVKARAIEIYNILDRTYPNAGPTINFSNPFELIVASIIGARATDESVNRVTKTLFTKYPDPERLAAADYDTLAQEIHDVGLADVKAKYLIATSRILIEKHHGTVPCSMNELTELPGVGRKIANMVLGNACGKPAMIVDTHVNRVFTEIGDDRYLQSCHCRTGVESNTSRGMLDKVELPHDRSWQANMRCERPKVCHLPNSSPMPLRN